MTTTAASVVCDQINCDVRSIRIKTSRIAMSAEFKKEAADHIIKRLQDTEIYKFLQSLLREAVLRIVRPETAIRVVKLSDQELVCHSMIYHFLKSNGYRAAAEIMQSECYEHFLSNDYLKQNVELYDDGSVWNQLSKHKLKPGVLPKREVGAGKETKPDTKFAPKPDETFNETKETLRSHIEKSAEESVKRKEELMMKDEEITEEEVDDEEEEEEDETEINSSPSSTTAESEPEEVAPTWAKRLWGPNSHQLSTDTIIATPSQPSRPSYLPPLSGTRPKAQLTSISSIDFDIPQLEKSPSMQSIDTPRASPSFGEDATQQPKKGEELKNSPEEAGELSEIDSITGIDQLLESDRSGSISF
ncbi:hypothetical protein RB195_006584 [Necator americanus]|uniref:LisH domain-containing protein n=1 Tax=Necator americanus TaxID=51031 RepID=A0ABR1BWA3_NECAM